MHLRLVEDKRAKSKSFFLKRSSDYFDNNLLNFLKDYFKEHKQDVRICLHKNSFSLHHDMIILQKKKNFYKPHKHLKKGETYHIITGSMICLLFNNKGKIKKKCLIKKNNIFRTPINTFHTMIPISNYVIYHESKLGPFLKKGDSIFPEWANKIKNLKL
jgi:glucose-6-phosphate isomerase